MVKSNNIFFIIVVVLCLIVAAVMAYATYYINYWPTDSWHFYIPASKTLNQLSYLSEIHERNRFESLHGKETLVLGVHLMQTLLQDVDSLYPNILLLIIAVAGSGLLIFLIIKSWLGPAVGFLGFLLFMTCFWPYLYVLQGAHQPLVLFNFLTAVLFLIKGPRHPILLLVSGIFLGLTQFSSPTAPVYYPYYIAIFLYGAQTNKEMCKMILRNVLIILSGALLVYFYISWPHPISYVKGYFAFIHNSQVQNNFTSPQHVFSETFPHLSQRGIGWSWIFKYLLLATPYLFIFYSGCLFYLLVVAFRKPKIFLLILVSVSSPIAVEIIKVAQFGRNYFSWLIGIIFTICYVAYHFREAIMPHISRTLQRALIGLLAVFLICYISSNVRIFTQDVFPSRMTTTDLYEWFGERSIKEVYVYREHPYKVNIVDYLNNPKRQQKLTLHPINTIREAPGGYILIPPITGKSIWSNCQLSDYRGDPYLLQLIDSGELKKYLVKAFPTLASSRIWPQEEEYCTYLDLNLGLISDEDRVRGLAFVLDADKLQHMWFKRNSIP